jgi:hypothetical protein
MLQTAMRGSSGVEAGPPRRARSSLCNISEGEPLGGADTVVLRHVAQAKQPMSGL